jgi:hypothetical protein
MKSRGPCLPEPSNLAEATKRAIKMSRSAVATVERAESEPDGEEF